MKRASVPTPQPTKTATPIQSARPPHPCDKKKNAKVWNFQHLSVLSCWGTRTRTRKGRTRICSVTITPYPNALVAHRMSFPNCGCKGTEFFSFHQIFSQLFSLFSKKTSKFHDYARCSDKKPYLCVLKHITQLSQVGELKELKGVRGS